MAAAMKTTALVLLLSLLAALSGCIMEDRVVELVLTDKTCMDFTENQTTVNFVTPAVLDYGEEINKILEDKDVSRDDIVSAHLVSAWYGVTSFTQPDDWTISGSVTIERLDTSDGPETIWDYTSVSISNALGKKIPVSLVAAGVGVLNRALEDFIGGANPILKFTVTNSGVTPSPSPAKPIQFEWRTCLTIDIVTEADMRVPNPF
jgi:hypothetical protein